MLKTPVLFIIFNRPETTLPVFEAIRKAKPKQLFVAADGPRPGKKGEKARCEKAREIATNVDWDCEVKTLFREENIGCGRGPAEAITWFFDRVEQGIVLEDDCLPTEDFFLFAEENLDYYKYNQDVFHISGTNIQQGLSRGTASYYFSRIPHMWGWASWKRAWNHYSFDLTKWKNPVLPRQLDKYWTDLFDKIEDGSLSSVWDYQWLYTITRYHKLCITPNVNLVENIGFTDSATHTLEKPFWYRKVKTKPLGRLKHKANLTVNNNADDFTLKLFKGKFGIRERVLLKYLHGLKP
jgi:hypothetical protein